MEIKGGIVRKSILVFCILTNLIFALEVDNLQDKAKEKDEEIILNVNSQNDNIGENSVRSHESAHAEEKK